MYKDAIVEEVRQMRDAYAKKFNYDLEEISVILRIKRRKASGSMCRYRRSESRTVTEAYPHEAHRAG